MRRKGFTLVELLFASAIVALFMILVYTFFIEGHRTMESTRRKVDAIGLSHFCFEEMRHDLETAAWAWAPPEKKETDQLMRGGGYSLYVGGKEYMYDT